MGKTNKGVDIQKERRKTIALLLAVVALAAFVLLINFIVDWLWFKEMGYVSVFLTQLRTSLIVGVPVFVVLTILINLYLKNLKKGYFSKIASHEETDMKKLNKTTNGISLLAGLVIAFYSVSNFWFQILKFANATDFDIKDPLFNIDISFYIFRLDFLKQLNEVFIGVVLLMVIITVIYYSILLTVRTPDIFETEEAGADFTADFTEEEERYTGGGNPFEGIGGNGANPFDKIFEGLGKKMPKTPKPKKHVDQGNMHQLLSIASGKLSVLGVIFFVMIAINFFLMQFDLLHVHTGAVYGAGFTDVNVTLWMYRILCGLAVIGAVLVPFQIKKKQFVKILTIPVIMIAVGAIGVGAAYVVQGFIVSPDEINKEEKYLERNIEYTQYAYQLDDVTTKNFAADNKLTSADIVENSETINNIRINDYQPVNTFYNQTQSIRQ
ncbi:MAG: UPF0182 family protein, partial [Firmicutes bacterium]|nr:UPF0182 family protein [Bacillota bacterium]